MTPTQTHTILYKQKTHDLHTTPPDHRIEHAQATHKIYITFYVDYVCLNSYVSFDLSLLVLFVSRSPL